MPPVGSRNYQFVVGVDADVLTSEGVSVVGHDPTRDPEDDWPPPNSVHDPISGVVSIYHHGQMRAATAEESEGLEPAAAWDLHHLIDRLMGVRKWGLVAAEEGSQAAILRGAVEQQYQDVVGSQSIRVRGPVLSGAMDTRTGDIFFGQNTGIPEPLAPELRSALEDFDGPGAAGKGIPGAHSEINAVNQGLLANPDSQISDYIFYSLRLRGALQGEPIEMCPNCAAILGQ
jgi:hypothetical protein